MINAYKKFWVNCFNFNGRSTRSDYWYVVLVNFIVGFILGFIAGMVPKLSLLSLIYTFVSFIPGIALEVRRLHDINKSGWNYLLVFIPIVGPILLLVYLCTDSVNENNKYGERV